MSQDVDCSKINEIENEPDAGWVGGRGSSRTLPLHSPCPECVAAVGGVLSRLHHGRAEHMADTERRTQNLVR